MILSQTSTNLQSTPHTLVKIQGCADKTIVFEFVNSVGQKSKRRYANKVLVHECVQVATLSPIDIEKAEFIATSDPCYEFFEIYKTSEDGGITLNTTVGGVDSVTINFVAADTCNLPTRLAYRLYGYAPDRLGNIDKLLLSIGNIYITPCTLEPCDRELWTGVPW